MDDYEKWKQDLRSKSINELETLIDGYGESIHQLTAKKWAIEDLLGTLQDQASAVRRMYTQKVGEYYAKHPEKTL